MRRTILALIVAFAGLAACDVSIEVRRGKTAPDAGTIAEAADPPPIAGTTGDAKPVLKDKSLTDEIGDVWNRVERDGKELARDAEVKAREVAKDAEKKADEIKKDVDETIDKKDLSPKGLLDKIPWWGWLLIGLGVLVLIAGILDALDIIEVFGEVLEVVIKLAVALAKGFVSLIGAVFKAFRRERRGPKVEVRVERRDPPEPPKPPRSQERDVDREVREAEARLNEARMRQARRELNEGRFGPYRSMMQPHPDNAPQPPRLPAPPAMPEPPRHAKRDSDDNDPGIVETVGNAVVAVVEGAGEVAGSIADAAGDIDLD